MKIWKLMRKKLLLMLLKEDLGIDSLDFVDIVVIVERNFGFKIKPEEMKGVDTYSKFCDYIETKVN